MSTAQVLSRTLLVIVAVGLGVALWQLVGFLLTPVVIAFLLSYCLGPLVNLGEDRGLPRWAAVLLVFGLGFALVAGLVAGAWPSLAEWLREPPSADETNVFASRLSERMLGWERDLQAAFPRVDWHAQFAKAHGAIESQRKELMETLPALALAALTNAGTFILAPIIALFILLEGAAMQKAVVALVPNRYFETVLVLLHRVDRQIAGYLRGTASESALVALLMSLVLWIAGMPKAWAFGLLYGVTNVIPMLGPVLGAGAGLLFSLVEPTAPSMSVLVACYGVVYLLDAMFINPLVVGKSLNLHPLAIILGISVGGHVAGILGMLVSIPLIAIGKAVFVTVAEGVRLWRLA